jgi:hypothetical protein
MSFARIASTYRFCPSVLGAIHFRRDGTRMASAKTDLRSALSSS